MALSNSKLLESLTRLRLPSFRTSFESLARQAELEKWSYEEYLLALSLQECQEREVHRRQRYVSASGLPLGKRLENFDRLRLSRRLNRQVESLLSGEFLSRSENVLAFGNPGVGKTHLLSGIGYELIQKNHRVFFSNCGLFVQDLLRAKAELKLSKHFKRLSKYDCIILDDLGYVQQSQEEMEVLFSFFADRYERGSVMISSNLAFSSWDQIFKNPMVTAAAVDRLIHYSIILEMDLLSYRAEQAHIKKNKEHFNKEESGCQGEK